MRTVEAMEKVLRGKRLRPNTIKNYRKAFTSLAEFSDEWPGASEVINEWESSLVNYSDSTVRLFFTLISAGAKYLKKVYKLPNPCEDAERVKVAKKKRRYFNPVELVAIIKACLDEYELLLILTLIDSACRIGELAGLSGKDVGDGYIDVVGKTGERRYRLDSRMCQRLRVFAGGDDKPVFKHRNGGFFRDGNALAVRARRIAVRAGLEGERLGVHTIRHSAASLMAQKTGQALIIKALLQHDDIGTSMRYIHDVDNLVVQSDEYSPLKVLGERYSEHAKSDGGVSQLVLADGEGKGSSSLVPVVSGLAEVRGALTDELFPVIPAGIAVRTVLKDDDLSVIREAFIFYARYNDDNLVSRARQLLRRMMRKGGSEFYARNKAKVGVR